MPKDEDVEMKRVDRSPSLFFMFMIVLLPLAVFYILTGAPSIEVDFKRNDEPAPEPAPDPAPSDDDEPGGGKGFPGGVFFVLLILGVFAYFIFDDDLSRRGRRT